MIRSLTHLSLVGVALALVPSAALAQDPAPAADKVSEGRLPKLPREPNADALKGGDRGAPIKSVAELSARPFEPEAYWAQAQLGMKLPLASGIRAGLEKMYLRDYQGARAHFGELEKQHGDDALGLAAVSDVLVWQALMLENFDFAYDKQYWVSSKKARADLDKALATPGHEGWERFLYTGVSGVEAIHTMRRAQYLSALKLAFEAMDHLAKSREAAPGFTDLMLADGMYNYWRSVITMTSKALPDFGDQRPEGLEQMQVVEREGVFLAPPATLSLAFSWIEEDRHREALIAINKNRIPYPDNVINNLLAGTTLAYMRRYDTAIEAFDRILSVDKSNKRARYWRGRVLLQSGNLEEAEKEFTTYLAFDSLEPYQRSATLHRLGQIAFRQKDQKKAEELWKEAVKVDGNQAAKDRLSELKSKGKSKK